MKIEPAASIEGAIGVPGVKGIAQRAAALLESQGYSVVVSAVIEE